MPERNSFSIRLILLLLILVAGSVQAQTLFVCEMMDQVLSDSCCDDHADADGISTAKADSCCEELVTLTVDHSADQSAVSTKPVEVRSDVDPPQAIFFAIHPTVSISTIGRAVYSVSANTVSESGSRTYLVTQRLRI